jgi:hypothetical protein
MGMEVEKVVKLVSGLENWEDWCHTARDFYMGPGGGTYCTRVMVNCSIENVDTVTDKAEYSTRSVSAREVRLADVSRSVHWSLRIRIQVMASLDRTTTRGQVSADLGR